MEDITKFTFLDVDGVLNSDESLKKAVIDAKASGVRFSSEHMSRELVERFDAFVEDTDTSIVISSTWRLCIPFERIIENLTSNGFTHEKNVIGVTPCLKFGSMPRGAEIQSWMESRGVKPEQIVIIDDNSDMLHLKHRLVLTSSEIGLSEKDVRKAKKLLSKGAT
jgi:hypothetical protein